ncbi:MAG: GPR endopeptidase, partial [Firmicutes bacterium]|nr:GPR endopeptidase [Bacillota bacterium]
MNNIILSQGIPFYDLALEARAAIRGDIDREIPGVKEDISETPYHRISTITIFNHEGEALMGRPCGTYITMDAKSSFDAEPAKEEMVKTMIELLGSILPKDKDKPVLVCGIGNPAIASDALGEKTISRMFPTRHLFQSGDIEKNNFHSCALFCPNVLGNTGIETAELIKGICENIHPCAVSVIDALS